MQAIKYHIRIAVKHQVNDPTFFFDNIRVFFNHNFDFEYSTVKTNAPAKVLWDILRNWAKMHPVKAERLEKNLIMKSILSKEPENSYNLEELHPEANPSSRKLSLSRFPLNPTAFWGPGTRSTNM